MGAGKARGPPATPPVKEAVLSKAGIIIVGRSYFVKAGEGPCWVLCIEHLISSSGRFMGKSIIVPPYRQGN